MATLDPTTTEKASIIGTLAAGYDAILSPEAMAFLTALHRQFDSERKALLAKRMEIQAKLNDGLRPDFPAETASIRESDWTVAPLPKDLLDRRVEITGPVDRKMVINALNSGAKVFMADFEDSNTPSWQQCVEGQINLRDAIVGDIHYVNPSNGKAYQLKEETATLMVRPRGLHLTDKHILIDGEPISGSLMDFGLFFFHNAKTLIEKGSGPYFYLPKLEHYKEARWWNEVCIFAQKALGIPLGTIKATVLVETILASFQLDEILYELKEHSAGLNCGRWDYIFSFIKRFHKQPGYLFPDRDQITMTTSFMRAYSLLVIKTCHRRGVHAMGGMAAQIPVKGDEAANAEAFAKVRADKRREAEDGHDGSWVAHPGLVPVAMEIFDEFVPHANQIDRKRGDIHISPEDLISKPEGTITEAGVRKNINVGIQYLAAWLSGNGAAAINHLMEDAATAEISRTQLWQWLHQAASLDDGRTLDQALYGQLRDEEIAKLRAATLPPAWKARLEEAIVAFEELIQDTELRDFLTLTCYEFLE
jgi:malate synthase